MCLLSFAWQPDSEAQLTLVSNRDEFHKRPTAPSSFWEPKHPNLLAGKDLEAGGTWMGVTRDGRFAALTNVRQTPAPYQGTISRGNLVKDYLISDQSPESFLNSIQGQDYDGFNLIVGHRTQCWYLGNRPLDSQPQKLGPGIYGLSNAQLNTPWPKTQLAKQALAQWIETDERASSSLHQLLNSTEKFEASLLPNTGIGEPWETLLSSPFIISPEYGTRACTSLQIQSNTIHWKEATMNEKGEQTHIIEHSF